MGATEILGLPWPEFGDRADAPDGIGDLARAVELKRTRFIGQIASAELDIDQVIGGGQGSRIVEQEINAGVIGWVEVKADVTIISNDTVFAGGIALYAAGVKLNSVRYHSQSKTNYLNRPIAGAFAVSGTSKPKIEVIVSVDATSNVVVVKGVNWAAWQYGTPAS